MPFAFLFGSLEGIESIPLSVDTRVDRKFLRHEIRRFAFPKMEYGDNYRKAYYGLLKKYVTLKGSILDFGCGYGSVLQQIKRKNCQLFGVELSSERVQETNRRLPSQKNFRGCEIFSSEFLEKHRNQFDLIFSTEVLEHQIPEKIPEILKILHHLLAPNGKIFIITPYKENLLTRSTVCPHCGAFFNIDEHLITWDVPKLTAYMEQVGFRTIRCHSKVIYKIPALNWLAALRHYYVYGHPYDMIYVGEKIA